MKANTCILFFLLFLSSCTKDGVFTLESLNLEKSELTMMVGEEATLRVAEFYPEEPGNYELRWRSDYTLLDVDSLSGKILAKEPGYASVNVYVDDILMGGCRINIKGVYDETSDVYICGFNNGKPVYWKNGFETALKTDKVYSNLQLSSIDVSNGDVYVVGSGVTGTSGDEVICWKNGEQIFSSEQGCSTYYDLMVNNGNCYILGFITDPVLQKTALWKNGERTDFLLENWTTANSMFVSGNDVYVAGESIFDLKKTSDSTILARSIAKYWKNSQEVCLTDSDNVAGAWDVAVANQDVFVAGWKLANGNKVAKYWKNGLEFSLNNENEWSDAQAIAIHGNDVYVLGMQKTDGQFISVCWKNGVAEMLEQEKDAYSNRSDIQVAQNGDVYIALFHKSYYYKNGEKTYFEQSYPNYPTLCALKIMPRH